MQVIVNYPDTEESLKAFNEQFALFHANLLIENIKGLNVHNESKEKILKGVLDKLKDNKKLVK